MIQTSTRSRKNENNISFRKTECPQLYRLRDIEYYVNLYSNSKKVKYCREILHFDIWQTIDFFLELRNSYCLHLFTLSTNELCGMGVQ